MNVNQIEIPKHSALHNSGFDYADCFSITVQSKGQKFTNKQLAIAFFESAPSWVRSLFSLRNKIVKYFGLKTGEGNSISENDKDQLELKVGERLGLFKVMSLDDSEIILGEDDSHLDFRVSIIQKDEGSEPTLSHIMMTTTVHYNNSFGKAYFFFVKPFHKTIVKVMMKRMAKILENMNR